MAYTKYKINSEKKTLGGSGLCYGAFTVRSARLLRVLNNILHTDPNVHYIGPNGLAQKKRSFVCLLKKEESIEWLSIVAPRKGTLVRSAWPRGTASYSSATRGELLRQCTRSRDLRLRAAECFYLCRCFCLHTFVSSSPSASSLLTREMIYCLSFNSFKC